MKLADRAFSLSIGDRITFRAATRWSDGKATRVVNGFCGGWPTVRYGGYRYFIVKPDEIVACTTTGES